MKPISSLSSFLSPAFTASSSDSGDRAAANQMMDGGHSNIMAAAAANPSPESNSSTPASTSSQDEKLGKQLIKDRRETPLSVLKLAPISMFTNNKVGASFIPQREALMNYGHQSATSIASSLQVLPVGARKSRDSGSLLFMLAFLGFLGYIIWDGLVVKETDINLIVHGHDSYGNICGRNNKPIQFVDKSGKNYTDKPFTKYTLINSQFERYTLDSNRFSKHGELFYVKQQQQQQQLADSSSTEIRSDFNAGQQIQRDHRLIQAMNHINQRAASNLRGKRAAPLDASSRAPASSTLLQALNEQQTRENRSLLNQLKSRLMYQYPPMYGYNPEPAPTRTSVASKQGKVRVSNDREVRAPDMLLTASSNVERTFASVRPAVLTTNPPATSTSFQSVIFDDHVGNDSDRYEHMLVTPTSTNGLVRPRQTPLPEGLNQNEVSNQLLYLTECVDHCPSSDHVELIFYRCMPRNWRFSLFPSAINVTRTFIDDILTDLSHCYREFIYIYSFGLVLSLVLLISLRFLASFIIWSCISLLIALLISTASYSWLNYYYQIIDLNSLMPHGPVYSEKLASSDKWLIGSIFLTFLAFASIGLVIFMRKRILLVTMLFRESGKAIADMPLLLLQPLLTFAALIAITVVWSAGLICLQSVKMPIIDMSTGFVVFKAEILYKVMKWYHIFAFLWVSHFAIACQHYVIGASVSKWYFATDRYNLHSPISASISELILYYLGSVALGSFLVAIFKVIRIITRQIQFLVQRNCMSPQSSPAGQTMNPNSSSLQHQISPTSCCGSFTYVWRFFIWFLDNIVMIINRDAYVEIAIHGDSFIAGAQRAFNVLSSNPLKLLAIKSVSNMLLVGAKICVVFGTVSMAMVLLEEKTAQLNYYWSPIVVSAIYAYIVAHWFLSVYEMVIDALFICYCEDYERSKNRELSNQLISSNFMAQFLENTHNNHIQTAY